MKRTRSIWVVRFGLGVTLLAAACSVSIDNTSGASVSRADDAGAAPIDADILLQDGGKPITDAGAASIPPVLTSLQRSSCATGADHKLYCWGDRANGRTGTTEDDSASPHAIAVSGLSDTVTAATVGYLTGCAVTTAGAVKCWGGNENGKEGNGFLGNPMEARANQPASVLLGDKQTPLIGAVTLGGSYYMQCASKSDKSVYCWGVNDHGEILCDPAAVTFTGSSGRTGLYACKMPAFALDTVKVVSGAQDNHCLLSAAGKVQCWTLSGKPADEVSTVKKGGQELSGVVDLAVGAGHFCALMGDGTVLCWGKNNVGQLGNGTTSDASEPTPVAGLSGVKAIALGGAWYGDSAHHSCALLRSGAIKCWGARSKGQLGDGVSADNNPATTPVDVKGIDDAVQISAGYQFSCARRASGKVQCWGSAENGSLGSPGGDTTTPRDVLGL